MKMVPRSKPKESMHTADKACNPGDAELIQKLVEGNLAALGTLYDRHHESIERFVIRNIGPTDGADVVHDVFLKLVDAASSYDGRPDARPFLIGIAAQLIRQKRQRLARIARALEEFAATLVGATQKTPEDAASNAQALTAFEMALSNLSEEKRLVFLMIETEGLSGNEVATALEIPVATVWTRLHYARLELRDAILKGKQR